MKAILVGRHSGNIVGMEVIEQRNIQYPSTSEECKSILEKLLEDAFSAKAALIFQGLPGQMVAAITRYISRHGPITHVRTGVIVSKPGERPSAKKMMVEAHNPMALEVAYFVNPNVRINGLEITVDAPMKFEFSHIEWL